MLIERVSQCLARTSWRVCWIMAAYGNGMSKGCQPIDGLVTLSPSQRYLLGPYNGCWQREGLTKSSPNIKGNGSLLDLQ